MVGFERMFSRNDDDASLPKLRLNKIATVTFVLFIHLLVISMSYWYILSGVRGGYEVYTPSLPFLILHRRRQFQLYTHH